MKKGVQTTLTKVKSDTANGHDYSRRSPIVGRVALKDCGIDIFINSVIIPISLTLLSEKWIGSVFLWKLDARPYLILERYHIE